MEAGEAMLFSIPVSWNVSHITDPNYKQRFSSGKLSPGKYKIGLQLEIYMNTEFEVNAERKSKVDDNTAKMQSIKWLGV